MVSQTFRLALRRTSMRGYLAIVEKVADDLDVAGVAKLSIAPRCFDRIGLRMRSQLIGAFRRSRS